MQGIRGGKCIKLMNKTVINLAMVDSELKISIYFDCDILNMMFLRRKANNIITNTSDMTGFSYSSLYESNMSTYCDVLLVSDKLTRNLPK